jgi:hypothetical protein
VESNRKNPGLIEGRRCSMLHAYNIIVHGIELSVRYNEFRLDQNAIHAPTMAHPTTEAMPVSTGEVMPSEGAPVAALGVLVADSITEAAAPVAAVYWKPRIRNTEVIRCNGHEPAFRRTKLLDHLHQWPA